MTAAYRLGSAAGSLSTAVSVFGVDPRATYTYGGEQVNTNAGTQVNVGYPRATWKFAQLTIAQYTALRTLLGFTGTTTSGTGYVETRNNEDSYAVYTAVIRLSELGKLERWGGRYLDFVLEFTLTGVVP